jgi:hypothetical protein
MSESIRERIIQAVMAVLQPVAQSAGITLIRSPPNGISREQSPALLIFAESDTVTSRLNDRLERQLVLRIVALSREGVGKAPETVADELLVAAHAAVFANANLGGLCVGVRELDCEWDVQDADAQIASLPARYQFSYRTMAHDLSLIG